MAQQAAVEERVKRYILDGGDDDLRRLLTISQESADMARAGFRRIGVQKGWTGIDCGCGPIGGLAVMAEMLGPDAHIVGVDFNEAAVQQARTVTSALGLSNVEVVHGDINELDSATLGGPFDLAYSRLFLMHQAKPAETMRRIAALLKPGGWLIAQEPLRTPGPRSHPEVDALGTYWALLHQVMERAGFPHDSVENLPSSAREAGLEVVQVSGYFMTLDARGGFDIHANTLAAARDRTIQSAVASEQEVDSLLNTLRGARESEYAWVLSPYFLDLTLRKPMPA